MEIRLFSLDAALWFEALDSSLACSSIGVPNRFGLTFARALRRRLSQCETVAELRSAGAVGVVLAKSGIRFQSPGFVASVAHALAAASHYDPGERIDMANEVESFVFGHGSHGSTIPPSLRGIGVYSVLARSIAERCGAWIQAIDGQSFTAEVAEIHGSHRIEEFAAAAADLRDVMTSVRVHQCDLCCIVGADQLPAP